MAVLGERERGGGERERGGREGERDSGVEWGEALFLT